VTDLQIMNNEPLGDFQSLTIPLKRAGRLFLIEAKIDDQTGNLIFDTGASGLVLNKTYFRKYASFEKPAGGGVTGAFDKISRIVVKRIDVSGMYYENAAADITDLGHIENRRGVKILGLLGLNMIDNFEIIFDAANNELQLNRIDKQGNRLNTALPTMKFDFIQKVETQHNIMIIKGSIGDKILNFCLDTGAESNVISNKVSKKVMNTIQINRRSEMGGAGARSIEVLYGVMNEFEFGKHQFGSMETVVTSLDAMSEAYGCSIDGMLGYDFWQKGIFCINLAKNEIRFSEVKGEKK
jgi:predicted aspartyl protease